MKILRHRYIRWAYKSLIAAASGVLLAAILSLSLLHTVLQSDLKIGNISFDIQESVEPQNVFYPARTLKGVRIQYKDYQFFFNEFSFELSGWNLIAESTDATLFYPELEKPALLKGVTLSTHILNLFKMDAGINANGSIDKITLWREGTRYELNLLDFFLNEESQINIHFDLNRYQSLDSEWDMRASRLKGMLRLDEKGNWQHIHSQLNDAQIVYTGEKKLWTYRGNIGSFTIDKDIQTKARLNLELFRITSFTPLNPHEKFSMDLVNPVLHLTQKNHEYWDNGIIRAEEGLIHLQNGKEFFDYKLKAPYLNQSHVIQSETIEMPFHFKSESTEVTYRRQDRNSSVQLEKPDLKYSFRLNNSADLDFFSFIDELMEMKLSNYHKLLKDRSFVSLPFLFQSEKVDVVHPEIRFSSEKFHQTMQGFQLDDESAFQLKTKAAGLLFSYLQNSFRTSKASFQGSISQTYQKMYPLLTQWFLPVNHPDYIGGNTASMAKEWYESIAAKTQLQLSEFHSRGQWGTLASILLDQSSEIKQKDSLTPYSKLDFKKLYFSGVKNTNIQWSQVSSHISYGNIALQSREKAENLKFHSLDIFHKQYRKEGRFLIPFRITLRDTEYKRISKSKETQHLLFNELELNLDAQAKGKESSELITYFNEFRSKSFQDAYRSAQQEKLLLKRMRLRFKALQWHDGSSQLHWGFMQLDSSDFDLARGSISNHWISRELKSSGLWGSLYLKKGFLSRATEFDFDQLQNLLNQKAEILKGVPAFFGSLITRGDLELEQFSLALHQPSIHPPVESDQISINRLFIRTEKSTSSIWKSGVISLNGAAFNFAIENTRVQGKLKQADLYLTNALFAQGATRIPVRIVSKGGELKLSGREKFLQIGWKHFSSHASFSFKKGVTASLVNEFQDLVNLSSLKKVARLKEWGFNINPLRLHIIEGIYQDDVSISQTEELKLNVKSFDFNLRPAELQVYYKNLSHQQGSWSMQSKEGSGTIYRNWDYEQIIEFIAILNEPDRSLTQLIRPFHMFYKTAKLKTDWHLQQIQIKLKSTGSQNSPPDEISAKSIDFSYNKTSILPWDHIFLQLKDGKINRFGGADQFGFTSFSLKQHNQRSQKSRLSLPMTLALEGFHKKNVPDGTSSSLKRLQVDLSLGINDIRGDLDRFIFRSIFEKLPEKISDQLRKRRLSFQQLEVMLNGMNLQSGERKIQLNGGKVSFRPFQFGIGNMNGTYLWNGFKWTDKNGFFKSEKAEVSLNIDRNQRVFDFLTKLAEWFLLAPESRVNQSELAEYFDNIRLKSRLRLGRSSFALNGVEYLSNNNRSVSGSIESLVFSIRKPTELLWEKIGLEISRLKLVGLGGFSGTADQLKIEHSHRAGFRLEMPFSVNIRNLTVMNPQEKNRLNAGQLVVKGGLQTSMQRKNMLHIILSWMDRKNRSEMNDFEFKTLGLFVESFKYTDKERKVALSKADFQFHDLQASHLSTRGHWQVDAFEYQSADSHSDFRSFWIQGEIKQDFFTLLPVIIDNFKSNPQITYQDSAAKVLTYLRGLETEFQFKMKHLKLYQNQEHYLLLESLDGKFGLDHEDQVFTAELSPEINLNLQHADKKSIPFGLTADRLESIMRLQLGRLKIEDIEAFLFEKEFLKDQLGKDQVVQDSIIDKEMELFFDGERSFDEYRNQEDPNSDDLDVLQGFLTVFEDIDTSVTGEMTNRLSSGYQTGIVAAGPANQLIPNIAAEFWHWNNSRNIEEERALKNRDMLEQSGGESSVWNSIQRGWNQLSEGVSKAVSSLTKSVGLMLFEDSDFHFDKHTTSLNDTVSNPKELQQAEVFQLEILRWALKTIDTRFLNPGLQTSMQTCADPDPEQRKTLDALVEILDMPVDNPSCSTLFYYGAKADELDLSNRGLQDISPLAALKSLKSLNLADNQIRKLDTLKFLKGLVHLNLQNNQIRNLAPLESLSNLEELNLQNNRIQNISHLQSSFRLQELKLGKNQVNSVQPLERLYHLQNLDLSRNRLSSIQLLKRLKRLKFLDISYNLLTEISALKHLIRLEELRIGANPLRNCAPENLNDMRKGVFCY